MKHDSLSDMFTILMNTETVGKISCIVPSSKVIKEILKTMQKKGYIGNFELIDDGKGGKFRVEMVGKINKCGVIKPRHAVGLRSFINWEKRYLPAIGMGELFVSTPGGVMSHRDATEQKSGGVLLGYIY
ncbi:MAG: 30S ribosomal protein S8 [Candidatus Aenigmarchaeota archaeon]|nr:30S ribosomal protein S8 [Candidatus Aenigmarchaeota archaeon]